MNPPRVRKIAVLGARAVGKSSLIIQFVESQFAETYYPTIENTFTKIIKHRGQEFAAEIIDTAGHDEYSILNPRHATGIHGYVLTYSINSRSSFEMCSVIRDKILTLTGMDRVPLVLVGNKADLTSSPGQRQVSEDEGRKAAAEWGASFVETSAKVGTNVTKIFELMLAEIEKGNGETEEKKADCVIL
ncbi:P-loop containing nucleoside triphosphate hydrolase protein [Zopfochytrium polystomum]|nr:P-loop containing nucleoside triphosphate hydrolase protein [Zopfochytrium polystomum]